MWLDLPDSHSHKPMKTHTIKIASCIRRPPPNRTPVLIANNVTMSLDWVYHGPACDGFHIFVHQANQAPGVFDDRAQVQGELRTWATDFDDPADAVGFKYYLVPMDGDENPLTPPSNTVNFAAG